jgi:hypothetical protein
VVVMLVVEVVVVVVVVVVVGVVVMLVVEVVVVVVVVVVVGVVVMLVVEVVVVIVLMIDFRFERFKPPSHTGTTLTHRHHFPLPGICSITFHTSSGFGLTFPRQFIIILRNMLPIQRHRSQQLQQQQQHQMPTTTTFYATVSSPCSSVSTATFSLQ